MKQSTKSLSGALNVLEALQNKKKTIDDYVGDIETSTLLKSQDDHPTPLEKESVKHPLETIISINPSSIKNWEFHDRPEAELGDLQALANDFIKVGQQQPCLVRPTPTGSHDYELIIGERRWRASILAGIKLKVMVNANLSDVNAALAQAAENDNRVDLSDYAKGMSFAKLIDDKIIKKKDLIEKLGRSKQYISALLSFSKIPSRIMESINDWSKVTSYTSETIARLSKKGDLYIEEIIKLSDKISAGKIGHRNLDKAIKFNIASTPKPIHDNKKVMTKSGRHVFTWRTDNNSLPSIHFPKTITDLFAHEKINIEDLSNDFLKSIEVKLNSLK
jgi:ParB family chromosome partitioning protein